MLWMLRYFREPISSRSLRLRCVMSDRPIFRGYLHDQCPQETGAIVTYCQMQPAVGWRRLDLQMKWQSLLTDPVVCSGRKGSIHILYDRVEKSAVVGNGK